MITAKEIIEYKKFLEEQVLGEFKSKGWECSVSKHNIEVYIREGEQDKVWVKYKNYILWIKGFDTALEFEEVQECVEMFKRAIGKVSDEDLEVLSL